jgi:hypothetical protein
MGTRRHGTAMKTLRFNRPNSADVMTVASLWAEQGYVNDEQAARCGLSTAKISDVIQTARGRSARRA